MYFEKYNREGIGIIVRNSVLAMVGFSYGGFFENSQSYGGFFGLWGDFSQKKIAFRSKSTARIDEGYSVQKFQFSQSLSCLVVFSLGQPVRAEEKLGFQGIFAIVREHIGQ